jgi:4-hydroxy-tetrahydrodipicolinate synthase
MMKAPELRERLKGVMVGIPTLFNDDFSINHGGMREYVDFLVEKGVKVLWISYGVSEFHYLTEQETRDVTKTVVDAARGRAIVITTMGQWWTGHAVEYAKCVEGLGADGLLVLTTFYPHAGYSPALHDDAFYRHFEAIAAGSDIPLLFHEKAIVAGGSRRPHSLQLIERVAAMEQVVGMKEQSGDELYFYEILQRVADKIAVIDDMSERSFFFTQRWGASGFITYMDVFPEVGLKFYDLIMAGEYARARRIVTDMVVPYVQTCESVGSLAATKVSMELRGLPGGAMRPPGVPLNPTARAKLKQTLEELCLLPEPRL